MTEFFIWVLCILLLLSAGVLIGASLVLHRAPKQPAKDPYDETDEEKADRNFFEYMDKLNKDIDRI